MDGILEDTHDLLGSTHNLMEGFVHFYRHPWVWSAKNKGDGLLHCFRSVVLSGFGPHSGQVQFRVRHPVFQRSWRRTPGPMLWSARH